MVEIGRAAQTNIIRVFMGDFTMSTSPGQGREASVNGSATSNNVEEKPRLSEHEKKANHIASGESRRQVVA